MRPRYKVGDIVNVPGKAMPKGVGMRARIADIEVKSRVARYAFDVDGQRILIPAWFIDDANKTYGTIKWGPTITWLAVLSAVAGSAYGWLHSSKQQARAEYQRPLCELAAACKKYSEARNECAAAGNLKACVRIKMGDDDYSLGRCSGYDDDLPPVSQEILAGTPSALTCFTA